MKNLIYFLSLFSTVVFSQNYNYGIEERPKQTTPAKPAGVNNQLEEIEYFKAYLLPLSQKATIQKALDTYGSVRLEKGDYSGVPIVMKSNQKLYGYPTTNNITSITIAAGSSNVHIESLRPAPNSALYVTFQAGAEISNCVLKNLKYAEISATNASIKGNTFLDIIGRINFNCSVSGYFRNNRIIKHQSQATSNMLVMKGNDSTPSYGNVNIHSNYLSSNGQTTDLDNLESSTFLGIDCETYGGLTRELFYAKNIDKLKLFTTMGGILYNSGFGYYNIDASEVYSVSGNGDSGNQSILSPRTNLLSFVSDKSPIRASGVVTGYFAKSYMTELNRQLYQHLEYNGLDQKSIIADVNAVSKLSSTIVGTQYTPWLRPVFETLPDPLGANWKSERVGKPDSTNYIQNLINTNGVADLPEGVFYISSTLNIPNDGIHGITGKGTGKTVICGLTDDFPLLSVSTGDFGNIILSYMTLQGGSIGHYTKNPNMMVSYQTMKYIVFRNQEKGMYFHELYGVDNNFYENLAFVNCGIGIQTQASATVINPNDINGSTYADKNVFYRCQFINSTNGILWRASRANNMNAWIDCKFDGGKTAIDMGGDATFFANCDFKNYTGDYTLKSNMFNLISCNFYNNTNSKSTLYAVVNNIEGCNFLDNTPLASPVENNSVQNYIANSTVTGNALVLPSIIAGRPTYATYVNSKLLFNPSLSRLFVNVEAGVPTIVIDTASNPYPQLLVTQ